jgi:hypothetical protein
MDGQDTFLNKIETLVDEVADKTTSETTKDAPVVAKLAVGEIKSDVVNLLNVNYLGHIYFGTPANQKTTCIFDTTSNWVAVKSDICLGSGSCKEPVYDHTNSSSAI